MPQTVEIPDQGVAEFPDDMTPDEIKGVIQKKFYSQPATTNEVPTLEQQTVTPPEPQTFASGSPREIAREQMSEQPAVQTQMERAGRAAGSTLVGLVKGLPQMAKFIRPPTLTDVLTGATETVGQMKTAINKPVGSQEWWNAVAPLGAQAGMEVAGLRTAASLAKTVEPPPIQKSPTLSETLGFEKPETEPTLPTAAELTPEVAATNEGLAKLEQGAPNAIVQPETAQPHGVRAEPEVPKETQAPAAGVGGQGVPEVGQGTEVPGRSEEVAPGYAVEYKAGDQGTERSVTVRDSTGKIIGQRDPFYPQGIPVSEAARNARIQKVANEIVKEAEQRRATNLGAKRTPQVISDAAEKVWQEAKAAPDEFTGIDATDLSPADRRELAGRGLSFTTDRQNRIIATYPTKLRVEDLRSKVTEKQQARLLPGETQGDLIASTQQEPFALVGEKAAPGTHPTEIAEATAKAQAAEEARLQAEHEQGLLEDLREHEERGGDEFLVALKDSGGLPAKSSPHQKFHGELQNVREAYQSGTRKEKIKYADVFRKDAPDPDVVAARMRAKGFDVSSDTDLIQMTQDRIASERPFYGMQARAQEAGITGLEGRGMGAAGTAEAQPRITGMKNRIIDEERVKRGLEPIMAPARQAMGKVWDRAMEQVEAGEARGENVGAKLVDDINARSKKDINETDEAVLLHERIRVQNEREMAAQRVNDENLSPEERVEAPNQWAAAEERLGQTELALHEAGTISGRALQIRQMMVRDDFTFAGMERRARAAKGGEPLTPEESDTIKKLSDRITQLETEAATKQTEVQETQGQQAFDQELGDLKKRASKKESGGEEVDLDAQRDKLISAILERASEGDTPKDIGNLVHRLALNFVRSGITGREALIDAVHSVIGEPFDIARHITRDLISGYGKYKLLDPEAAKATLRQLKGEMQQIGKIEDMAGGEAPKKTGVERRTPSDEERRLIRQVNEMKKKGGFQVTDPARQLKSALDAVKTRLMNQIRDLSNSMATRTPIEVKKGGVPYDAVALKLKEIRDKMKSQYDEIFGKKGLTDEQRLEIAKGAAERSLKSWEERLADAQQGKFTQPGKTRISSPEIDAIRAQRESVKAEVEALQKVSPTFQALKEQKALALYKARITQRIADLQEKIARGDFTRKPKPQGVRPDNEVLRLQAQATKLKQQFETGILKKRMEQRSMFEKMADTFLKYRRAFVLSWPTIFEKLGSAAALRTFSEPIESGVGAVLRQVPGIKQVAARAPIEGQTTVGTIARSTAKAFTTGLKDSWQTLTTGKSDLDRLYGRVDAMPRSWVDFFGTLHAVMKAPIKRLGFETAMENQIAHGIRNGVDVTDPIVQTQMALRSYAHGERLIFMQQNKAVSAFNAAVRRFEQPEAGTGRPTVGGKLAATAIRTPLPIVKVPTNIVAEIFDYTLGHVTGGVRLGAALKRGVANLPEAQADSIMRQLKKGSVGGALILFGYYNRNNIGGYFQHGEKRKDTDVKPGEVRIGDTTISHNVFHSAVTGPMMIGATIGRVADTVVKGEKRGLGEGLIEGLLAPIQEVPFLQGVERIKQTLEAPSKTTAAGEAIGGSVTPGLVQYVARKTDQRSGETVKRKPTTFTEGLMENIPGLRQNLPEKKPARQKKPKIGAAPYVSP